MKHLRHLFLAFLLLFVSAAAMAQTHNGNTEKNTTEWAVRADVNGDGVVNEADIAEILAIMKQNSKQKYYWYVGQENPAEMTSIFPIVGDAVSNGVGFRVLDITKTYSASNKLYDGINNPIEGDKSATWYIMLPATSNLKFYDDLGESPLESITTTKDFGDGVKYIIYLRPAPRPVNCVSLYIYH